VRIFLCIALTSLAAAAPLPREIVPGAAMLEPQADRDGLKIWHTRFFQLESGLALRANDLQRLAQVADTTAMAVKAHPLPWFAPPGGGRPRITIVDGDAAYREQGGTTGTAGFYLGREGRVIVHGGYFLRSPDAARSRLAPRHDEDIVVHELVHLCMHRVNRGLPPWFVEGVAEYFASAHQGAGRFSFGDMDTAIRQHLRVRLSPDDPGIPLLPVAEVVDLDGRGWLRAILSLPVEERYRGYATSLLLAHYQLHGGEKRLEVVRRALAAAPEARRPPEWIAEDDRATTQQALLRYWKPKGLTLEFAPGTR
jgi:hypothetical protein